MGACIRKGVVYDMSCKRFQFFVNVEALIPVANLRKTTIYNTNKNLVNDDVYTKFGLILSICSQDIE